MAHCNLNTEVIIVGAGIAGIAASKVLKRNGIPHLVLEANDRMGGRAKKANSLFGNWFDLGCSYLHEGQSNPLVAISERYEVPVRKDNGDIFSIEKTNFLFNGCPFSTAVLKSIISYDRTFKAKLSRAEEQPLDQTLSSCLKADSPNYPIFYNLLTGLNAIEPELVSLKDFISFKEGQDYTVESGITDLIEKWGCDLDIKFRSPVSEILWSGNDIHVKTKNNLFKSKKILLTVSNGVLSNNSIEFSPKLPSSKVQAISNLPMGTLNKAGILFKKGTFQEKNEGWYVACNGETESKISSVMSFEIRTRPENHMIIFFGGKEGKELENFPERTFARIKLVVSQTFGHDLLNGITNFVSSSWGSDVYSVGSYSYALPGKSKEREQLRKPLENKLFFAGEATNKDHYGTCHGAYMSGIQAAKEIIKKLNF